jgi:hypothetical protein
MLDTYDDSMIFIIKNNLDTSRDLNLIIKDQIEYNLIPLDNEEVYLNEQEYNLKYGISQKNATRFISIKKNNNIKEIAYQISLKMLNEIENKIENEYEVIGYSPGYNILNSEYSTEYNFKITSRDILCRAFKITYVNNRLHTVTIKGGRTIEFYKELDEIEINEIKSCIVDEMYKKTKQTSTQYSKEEGKICFIAFESFYDGLAFDIGVRIGLETERKKYINHYDDSIDIRIYTGDYKKYIPLLSLSDIENKFKLLLQYLKRTEDGSNIITETMDELIERTLTKLDNSNFLNNLNITDDFIIFNSGLYD